MLEAFDLTGSLRDAGELSEVSHHTVARIVAARDDGVLSDRTAARAQLIDEYLPKIEEWVERSARKVRADVAHDKLAGLGFTGSERTTRRAVAVVKRSYRVGRVRVHRPWVTEPGMWLQYDFGDGPVIDGVKTTLFVAWLAWSRFRVVLAIRDKTTPSVLAALDAGDAPPGWGADVSADRQREDRHGRARGRHRGPEPGDGRVRPPLRRHGAHLCAGGPPRPRAAASRR